MSYAKAMKHWRNIRKCRKMVRGHFLMPQVYEITEKERQEKMAYLRKMQGK